MFAMVVTMVIALHAKHLGADLGTDFTADTAFLVNNRYF
jgi:hypothetical protein